MNELIVVPEKPREVGMSDFAILESRIRLMRPDVRHVLRIMLTDRESALNVYDMIEAKKKRGQKECPEIMQILSMIDFISQIKLNQITFRKLINLLEATKEEDHAFMEKDFIINMARRIFTDGN